jgi:hypothetical protein
MPDLQHDRWQSLQFAVLGGIASGLGAIAGFWGGLFGITYRYAVRGVRDRQWQAGVVLAFGITAGLARWEGVGEFAGDGWAIAWVIGTALGLLAIAAIVLQVLSPKLQVLSPKLSQDGYKNQDCYKNQEKTTNK